MHQYNLPEIKALIENPQKIVITMHQRPDGDAIGSALGLYHFLTSYGHDLAVVAPTDYPDNLKWMPGTEQVVIGPNEEERAKQLYTDASVIFFLDLNDPKRIAPFEEVAQQSAAQKVMIDHHLDPKDFYNAAFWDDKASSTAEMIHRLIDHLGAKDRITPEGASCLYAGTLTDTGSFRFPATSPAVHRMVAELIEAGANNFEIYENIYSNNSERRLRLTGYALSNRLHVLPSYHTAYIMLNAQDVERFNIGPGDTEGLVNYSLSIKGINFGVFMIEKDGMIKMSFRSRGKFPANEVASHFSGGGHFNAAGGRSMDSLSETQKRFLDLIEDYKDQLDY